MDNGLIQNGNCYIPSDRNNRTHNYQLCLHWIKLNVCNCLPHNEVPRMQYLCFLSLRSDYPVAQILVSLLDCGPPPQSILVKQFLLLSITKVSLGGRILLSLAKQQLHSRHGKLFSLKKKSTSMLPECLIIKYQDTCIYLYICTAQNHCLRKKLVSFFIWNEAMFLYKQRITFKTYL